MLTTRFCFETAAGPGCKSVSGSVKELFGLPAPGSWSSTVIGRGNNGTVAGESSSTGGNLTVVRRPSAGDSRHPSSGTECQDLFSARCVEKILRYCITSNSSTTVKETRKGCELAPSICIVSPVFPGGLATCLNPACLDRPHGPQCIQAMQAFCVTQPPSWHCSPFQAKKVSRGTPAKPDPVALHFAAMTQWVKDLALPPGDKSYNDKIYQRRTRKTVQSQAKPPVVPPPLYPSAA